MSFSTDIETVLLGGTWTNLGHTPTIQIAYIRDAQGSPSEMITIIPDDEDDTIHAAEGTHLFDKERGSLLCQAESDADRTSILDDIRSIMLASSEAYDFSGKREYRYKNKFFVELKLERLN